MFMHWKSEYCSNVHTTQSNLLIQCNPYQNSNGIFHRNTIGKIIFQRKTMLKFIWNHKMSQIAKTILCKKSEAGDLTLPDFKLYYKGIVIKAVWYWHKDRHIDQWNRIKSPEIIYNQLVFNKVAKNTQWGKDGVCNKWQWGYVISTCKRTKLDPNPTPDTKVNSQ